VALPAIAVLGFWIVIQLINGLGSLGVRTESGGVAYMAHVGGFGRRSRTGQAIGGKATRDRLSRVRSARKLAGATTNVTASAGPTSYTCDANGRANAQWRTLPIAVRSACQICSAAHAGCTAVSALRDPARITINVNDPGSTAPLPLLPAAPADAGPNFAETMNSDDSWGRAPCCAPPGPSARFGDAIVVSSQTLHLKTKSPARSRTMIQGSLPTRGQRRSEGARRTAYCNAARFPRLKSSTSARCWLWRRALSRLESPSPFDEAKHRRVIEEVVRHEPTRRER